MKEYKLNMHQALEKVREQRPIVDPNEGFLRQLEEYNGILNAKVDFQNSILINDETSQELSLDA